MAASNPQTVRRVALSAALASLATFTGCELDSYLDPSIVGRWERTPTTVPILERIAAIEGPEEQFVEYTDIQPEDLIPEIEAYRSAPGDGIRVTAYDLIVTGRPDLFDRTIDSRGMVSLPQLGEVFVSGMTADEIEASVRERMSALVGNPLVTVEIISPRQRTFTIFGAVSAPGPYFVPTSEYRLLEALNTSGTFDGTVEYIDVYKRQVFADHQDSHPQRIPRSRPRPPSPSVHLTSDPRDPQASPNPPGANRISTSD